MRYTAAVMSKELYDPTVTLKLRRGRTNSRTSIWKPILNQRQRPLNRAIRGPVTGEGGVGMVAQ